MGHLRWLATRKLELLILAVGITLRLSMTWNYHCNWSYDSDLHWELVQWMVKHGKVAPVEATFEAFHPPLWYGLAAWFVKHGATRASLVWISIVSGVIRLVLLWVLLELLLPRQRVARTSALALAAVTCISIQMDGMVYNEALNGLISIVGLLLLVLGVRKPTLHRWPFAVLLGVTIGLALLTKASGVVLFATTGCVVLFELVFVVRPWRVRLGQTIPWVATALIAVSVSGWYYARNVREYGKPFVTSFDLPSQQGAVEQSNKLPALDRRTLGYLFDWDRGISTFPFGISAVGSHPRFFAVAVASTFVDFWGYGFQGYDKKSDRKSQYPIHGDREPFMTAAVIATMGGTVIFAATLLAWFTTTFRAFQERRLPLLAFLLFPLIATLAAIQFSLVFPVDVLGVVKGAYLLFAAPPLCALFGVAVSWAKGKWHRWPILVALLLSLYGVAAYSIECRLHIPVVPHL